MFTQIWKDMQGKLYKRRIEAEETPSTLTTNAMLLFRQAEDSSRIYDTTPSPPTSALVFMRRDPSQEFSIRLIFPGTVTATNRQWMGTCSCGRFQNDCMPCPHALAFIHDLKLAPLQFIHHFFTKEALLATYRGVMPPLLCSNLQLDESIIPPAVKTRRGRPQMKRQEQGAALTPSQITARSVEHEAQGEANQSAHNGRAVARGTGRVRGIMRAQGGRASENITEPLEGVARATSSEEAAARGGRRQRQKRNPWAWIDEGEPQVEVQITSRTRSGAVQRMP
jgi:hypothetical protein